MFELFDVLEKLLQSMIFTELTTFVYQFKHMTNSAFWAEAVS